jgi:hypothetical protein
VKNYNKLPFKERKRHLDYQYNQTAKQEELLIKRELKALEEDSDVITYGYRKDFPSVGEVNKMYVAADEGKTYIWFNDDYLPVGGGDYEEPTTIYGGDSGI